MRRQTTEFTARRSPFLTRRFDMRSQTTTATREAISEPAVRDAFGRHRRSAREAPKTGAQRAGNRRLRRWSVAELIAAAAVRPQAGRLGH